MESVRSLHQTENNITPRNSQRDTMNNELSSTSSEDCTTPTERTAKLNKYYSRYDRNVSDNEMKNDTKKTPNRLQNRSHYKSMGNIHDDAYINETNFNTNMIRIQNSMSNIDVSLHGDDFSKYGSLQVPIVGYEVMEERARFTIYKLKVQDDKSNRSWLVFRRYTDFVRLYSRIKAEQPNIMLPLPGKRWFRDNFEPAFLEERVRGLQTFVNAVLKRLPAHSTVREFFCLDEPPQVFSYQPEVQAVYGALEDSISSLKMQMQQKDATIGLLQKRLQQLEVQVRGCENCGTKSNFNL